MKITPELTDQAVLQEIASRLERHRIESRLTQAVLAAQAGVAKRTIERIERGHAPDFVTLIRVLRVLKLTDGLENLVPPLSPGPMALLKLRGRARRRVSLRTPKSATTEGRGWAWANDE
jgi:transcriptional regulator with XRE-family HTH domain